MATHVLCIFSSFPLLFFPLPYLPESLKITLLIIGWLISCNFHWPGRLVHRSVHFNHFNFLGYLTGKTRWTQMKRGKAKVTNRHEWLSRISVIFWRSGHVSWHTEWSRHRSRCTQTCITSQQLSRKWKVCSTQRLLAGHHQCHQNVVAEGAGMMLQFKLPGHTTYSFCGLKK